MSRFGWLPDYLHQLEAHGIAAPIDAVTALHPARRLRIDAAHWGVAAEVAAASGIRWAGVWCDPRADRIDVSACLVHRGDYLVLATEVPLDDSVLPSQAGHFPAADRMERHLHDLAGVVFSGQPDVRRWTRHLAWSQTDHPLRLDFPAAGRPPRRTAADSDYPFVPVHGSGVYEIPVGPVHAGIIEPGHFRFQAVGEDVLTLEIRLGYVHKGIEKLAVDRDAAGLARLAGRVSGDSTVAHTWAACQAMERAAGCEVPPRANYLRALLAERERVANHLGDIGAICNDVGFAFAHVQCARLREQWQRRSRQLFGHRLLMDIVVPGGVAGDLGADDVETLRCDLRELRRAVDPVFRVVDDHPSLDDRLIDTGKLTPATAHALGCLGYVGKASGLALDVRMLNPYAPYDDITLEVPVSEQGDVAARVRVRMAEVTASIDLMEQLLDMLPDGPVAVPLPAPAPDAAGLGIVEGWRGEILTYVRFGESGRIARFFPRDPSWFTWPALERLIQGNIVPDFPVCNKSVNGSYSAQDL
jgi:Ni,Fe-hydrogenase III large subunit/NADH:ubiquinone oxidoreductase subunit C